MSSLLEVIGAELVDVSTSRPFDSVLVVDPDGRGLFWQRWILPTGSPRDAQRLVHAHLPGMDQSSSETDERPSFDLPDRQTPSTASIRPVLTALTNAS